MTIESAISNLTTLLQKRFPDYALCVERNLTIYRKGSNGKVICWGNILESERSEFENKFSFMYFVGSTTFELHVTINTRTGEKISRRIGCFKMNTLNNDIIFAFATSEFKSLRRFLKSAFKVQPKNKFSKLLQTEVSNSSRFSVTEWFNANMINFTELFFSMGEFKNPPTTISVYEIIFSNNEKMTYKENDLKNAMEYMTKQNLTIVENRKLHRYEWL